MILDDSDLIAAAGRNPAPAPPATFSEALRSEFNLAHEQSTTTGAFFDLRDEYSVYLDSVAAASGQRLGNPFDEVGGTLTANPFHPQPTIPELEQKLLGEVSKLRETDPNIPLRTPEDIRAAVAARRKDTREEAGRVAARSVSTAADVGAFLGQAAGTMLDPPMLASMAFGAPAAAGIVRGALTDAGIALGSETVYQLATQGQRAEFGETPDLGQAAGSVLAAGAGTAVLSLGLRGAARALSSLRSRSTEVDDAAALLERRTAMTASNPFGDTAPGHALHAERFDAALSSLRSDEAAAVPALGVHERALVDQLAAMADEPARFAAYLDTVRFPPKVEGLTLMQFLRAKGGLKADVGGELANMGITPRRYPGFISRKGLTLDDAALYAWEDGYFPEASERPDIEGLLHLLDEEVNRGRPSRTLEGADQEAALNETVRVREGMEHLGLDLERMKPAEIAKRVRAMAMEPPSGNRAVPSAHADVARVEAAEASGDSLDAMREAQIRAALAERGDMPVWVETADGQFERMKAADLFAKMDREADDTAALKICLGGGR